ncbi:eukaryotic translation initiation factor 2C, 2 [Linnemannia zychae]|nr:eukaryotic translation initiation factor 2C, 2 [Linnemannia zychae]
MQVTEYVKRSSPGKSGRVVNIYSNFFEIRQLPNITVHHYDVTITPDVPPPVNRKIFEQLTTSYRESDLNGARPVYDGRKNMFSPRAFPFESRTFEIMLNGDLTPNPNSTRPQPKYKVKVKKASTINLEELHRFLNGRSSLTNNCLTAIMALDVLIRHQPAMLYATIGRSFYTPIGKQALAGPLDAWRGYYQSARPALGKMMINIDVSATAFFRSGSLLELIVKIANVRNVDDLRRAVPPINWKRIEKAIKGLRFTVSHRERGKRSFKIMALTETAAKDTKFKFQHKGTSDVSLIEEGETDLVTYFKKTYSISLSYPMLPCVHAGKSIMLPIELCSVIEGQRCMKKLDERQTADMIKFTSQSPHTRANNIKDGLKILKYDDNEYLREFGMKVSNEMVQIKARVLPPPTVCYHPQSREANFVPRDGSWNLLNKKVTQGTTLGSWGVVVFGTDRDCSLPQINKFVRELIISCTETGMNVPNKSPPVMYNSPHGDIESHLKNAWIQTGNAVKSQPQLLVCILPNTGVPLYAEIKRVTDTVLGVSSQCIQMKHTRDPKKQYCSNVCLKMNVKLGGMNQCLNSNMMPFLAKPTIVLGGDVSHPQPGDNTRPSIACLVGSMDSKAARYAATVRVQTARTETIADLGSMTIELLRTFYQNCGRKPERILFYRDGVSEGQFAEILKTEVADVKTACQKLEAGYNPTVTFVVVQKRHHTRFFPMRREEGDRTGNCMPGTVVDQEIVHPTEFDFYLQSHVGLLSTSRPAHYYVLYDDNKFTSDELQDLSYKLCHLFARCTRTVSYVPPAYYAHIVASRARFHARGDRWSDTMSSESGAGDASSYLTVKPELMRAKTEFDGKSREEHGEDLKMDTERCKLAAKMEDIKIENENGIELLKMRITEGLNGIALSKVRGILCSDAEILSSSEHFKRDSDFPFVRLDADVAEFFIHPDRFQAWFEGHQRSISTKFNLLRKYEYNDPDQQYRLSFACQCTGKKRVHRKSAGEGNTEKNENPIKRRTRAPSIKQGCLSRIAALFQPIQMADGSRIPGCVVEYRYQHNHSLGDITDLGTRQKSATLKSTIERLLKQGSSIQRVMQQLTMDNDKFTQITRGNDQQLSRNDIITFDDVYNIWFKFTAAAVRKDPDPVLSARKWMEEFESNGGFTFYDKDDKTNGSYYGFASLWQLQQLKTHGSTICFDRAHNVFGYVFFTRLDVMENRLCSFTPHALSPNVRHSTNLFTLVLKDTDTGFGVPVAFLLTKTSHAFILSSWLTTLCKKMKNLFSTDEEYNFLPNAVITDQGDSEILALKTAFPGVPIFYCAWHVLRVWEHQVQSKMSDLGVHHFQKREQIREQRKILYEKDKATAQELIKTFRETWSDQKQLLDYLNMNYFGRPMYKAHELQVKEIQENWMLCYRQDISYASIDTNNYIKSWHDILKRHFFRDNQQRRSDAVIYILAILAVPHFQGPKGYTGAYIKQISDDTLYVESFTKPSVGYDIKIDFSKSPTGHIIGCSCPYFQNHRSCCKHISLVQIELSPISFLCADIWEHQSNFHSEILKPNMESHSDDVAPEIDQIKFAIQHLRILEELRDKKADFPQRMFVQTKLQEALDLFEATFPRCSSQNVNNKRPRQE